MEATLEKQGDSLILPIPHEAEHALGLNEGDAVEMSLKNSTLVVTLHKNSPNSFEELWGDYPPVEVDLEISGVVGDEEHAD